MEQARAWSLVLHPCPNTAGGKWAGSIGVREAAIYNRLYIAFHFCISRHSAPAGMTPLSNVGAERRLFSALEIDEVRGYISGVRNGLSPAPLSA